MKTDKELQESAKWLWDRKDEADHWSHFVLTNDNPDPSSLNLDKTKAFAIFTILEQRNLMLPFPEYGPLSYKINHNKADEWKDLTIEKGLWKRTVWPFIKKYVKKFHIFIKSTLIIFATGLLYALGKYIIDTFFK